ncbi:MAG: hypothetical protein IKU25_03465 [Clostridia bacterium]|nr:hypothetical protein [Clostridia bacterium]
MLKKIIMLIIALLMLVSCGESVDPALTPEEQEAVTLENAVRKALFNYHEDGYKDGECEGVGFVIMGQADVDGNTHVYTINMYGVYDRINDAMCKIDGHSCIPMVVVLDKKLRLVEVKEPVDGEGYMESVFNLFPEEYRTRIFDLSIEDYTTISAMEAACISEYLEKKGLEMVIKQ